MTFLPEPISSQILPVDSFAQSLSLGKTRLTGNSTKLRESDDVPLGQNVALQAWVDLARPCVTLSLSVQGEPRGEPVLHSEMVVCWKFYGSDHNAGSCLPLKAISAAVKSNLQKFSATVVPADELMTCQDSST